MPFIVDPTATVVPTIASSLPSMASMTGASTFHPPCASWAKAEQGMGALSPRLGPALSNTTLATATLRRQKGSRSLVIDRTSRPLRRQATMFVEFSPV
jgi:hypothetical protein